MKTKNSKTSLIFTLIQTTSNGNPVYRVSTVIPGFGPSYLVKPEGENTFPNRSAAIKAAKRRATTLGYGATIRCSKTASTESNTTKTANRSN
jgi:hypothetical protein